MKVKNCHICQSEEIVMFRVQSDTYKHWIFVCKTCCVKEQKKENYKYGGTWKGVRH